MLKFKAHCKSSVFKAFLKDGNDGAKWASLGRECHNQGATTEKAFSLASATGGIHRRHSPGAQREHFFAACLGDHQQARELASSW